MKEFFCIIFCLTGIGFLIFAWSFYSRWDVDISRQIAIMDAHIVSITLLSVIGGVVCFIGTALCLLARDDPKEAEKTEATETPTG